MRLTVNNAVATDLQVSARGWHGLLATAEQQRYSQKRSRTPVSIGIVTHTR